MLAITHYLQSYRRLFVGREDDYAIQLSSGRYRRVGKPLTKADLYDHLLGIRTYGTYIMDASGLCRFAVIDADSEDGLERLFTIAEQLAALGIMSYVERSRRGGHLWIFFARPVRASMVRAWLRRYCPADLEFYPKQDEGRGYGSLIRLPFGVHRKSRQRYPFVGRGPSGVVALTTTDEERANFLASVQLVEVPEIGRPEEAAACRHSQQSDTPQSFSQSTRGKTSGSSPIREWNAAQDHYQVIGRYVSLNDRGVGQCPFGDHHQGGEDTQASFKVYEPGVPGGYCWYCYTWQKGGSLFDFLKYYFHLDTQELWQRIQAETI